MKDFVSIIKRMLTVGSPPYICASALKGKMVYSIYCVMILIGKPQLHVGTSRYLFILTCEIRTCTQANIEFVEDRL